MYDLNVIKMLQKQCSFCGSKTIINLGFTGKEYLVKCAQCGKQRYQE